MVVLRVRFLSQEERLAHVRLRSARLELACTGRLFTRLRRFREQVDVLANIFVADVEDGIAHGVVPLLLSRVAIPVIERIARGVVMACHCVL